MKYKFKQYKRVMGSHYNGLKLGPGYMNLTIKAFANLKNEGFDRVEIYYDFVKRVIALKPTDKKSGFSLNQAIHCRLLVNMPWERYYFVEKNMKHGFIYRAEEEK